MAEVAKKTDPAKWERAKTKAKAQMGGKHSARAMQLATDIYKKSGGGYSGAKSSGNKLSKWTKEEWGTKSGKKSSETGERYLPKAAIKSLSDSEYAATTRAKRAGKARGEKVVKQPERIAKKTARHRA